ncbi:MAG TPA: AMP-binding protein [Anaeromyxobacter sp.]|nr:AMP-binding protein [Anaeromyxobacter sp.]
MTPRQLTPRRSPARTVPGLLLATARRAPDRIFIRFLDPERSEAPPREITFHGFLSGVARAAAALAGAGLGPGSRLLLAADNSPEWQMLALGAQVLRAEPAAVFASLGAGAAREAALRVGPRVVFASGAAQWEKLAPAGEALKAAGLSLVVTPQQLPVGALPSGVRGLSLAEACGEGARALPQAELEARATAVGEEDPYLLLFTSGTTGRPKGVRLPQRAIVHAIEGGEAATGSDEADRGLHFLPFAHVAGHDQFVLALAEGHELVMFARREDLPRALSLGPTYLFSVPLVYERVRLEVEARLARLPGPLRAAARGLLEGAVRARVDGSRRAGDRARAALAGALLGRAVRRRLGGRVRGLFSGGAPASPALFRFFEGLGIPFVELYGMSETAGLVSSNAFGGPRRAGCAGLITADHELRLAPDGELLLRGPLLFSGYLDEADNREAFTADGFFRTGDVGRVDEEGLIRVEGRKKALLVLSTGKKLCPEPIEVAIAGTPPFQGAVLLGEGRPFVSAVVFVAREEVDRLRAGGLDPAEALLPRARAALGAFSEYEKPKRLVVLRGGPQEHPDLLTPTLKLRREALLEFIGSRLSELYAA